MKEHSRYLEQYTNPKSHHNTPTPRKGEIWYADALLFADGVTTKGRPVLVIACIGGNVQCYKCTTKDSASRNRYEVEDLGTAGLAETTWIDPERITVPKNKLIRKLGTLSREDAVNSRLLPE